MNTSNVAPPGKAVAKPSINFFERYLTVWVALCIVAGIALGQVLP
ncbi:arsenical-resistance protein, partial [Burkholderia cenocepacia]|nr:arsenical-resistance protein [Burkholderia cenocepacia]